MPFGYAGSVALGVAWAVLAWGQPRAPLIVVALVLLGVSVLLSVTLLVPINARVARWSREGAPADWRRQVVHWDRLHHVRVGVIGTAFMLLVVAGLA